MLKRLKAALQDSQAEPRDSQLELASGAFCRMPAPRIGTRGL